MFSNKQKELYYQAILEKQTKYEGLSYFAVKTTGTFCRSTCPARAPKFENCEFFLSAEEAQHAAYRPCRRCHPLLPANQVSKIVKILIDAVENNPSKRWSNKDLQFFSIDPSTARRQFKKRFGMTFIEYARAKRMGLAAEYIKQGNLVIDTQFSTGYDSSSGFRNAFSGVVGVSPSKQGYCCILKSTCLDTRLGPMLAIADDKGFYVLEFIGQHGMEVEIETFKKKMGNSNIAVDDKVVTRKIETEIEVLKKRAGNPVIIPGENAITRQIEAELEDYFSGNSLQFNTPVYLTGSPFQKSVWKAVREIPSGETRSYSDIANSLENPSTFRAVVNASTVNQLAIIVPCHRVAYDNGAVDDYKDGNMRKQWLLAHENKYKN